VCWMNNYLKPPTDSLKCVQAPFFYVSARIIGCFLLPTIVSEDFYFGVLQRLLAPASGGPAINLNVGHFVH